MKKVIFLLLAIIFICACRSPADIDLENPDNKIVLNSAISPDSTIRVCLYNQLPVFFNDWYDNPRAVSGASVVLFKNNNVVDTLVDKGNGEYISEVYPNIGVTYKVEIRMNSTPMVSAADHIPKPVEIDTIYYRKIEGEYSHNHRIFIRFNDPPGKNYYYLFFNNKFPHRSTDPVIEKYDPGHGADIVFAFNDELFDNRIYEIYVDANLPLMVTNENWDYIHYELLSISEDFYKYCKSLNGQIPRRQEDIFELYSNGITEPVPIHSNVENGLGIFAGYSSSRDSVYIPESDL